MSGFQFLHLESYSRKADKGGRTVSNVLDEAERKPGSCEHVEHPAEPEIVFGCGVDTVRARHDEAVAEARSQVSGGKPRKVRADQHTILTAVTSHPATMDQVRGDPAVAAEVAAWQARAVEWMRATWGDRLVSVIRHSDEGHPHLHAYVLSDGDMKAKRLHPGHAAKEQAKSLALAEGGDARAANGAGDKAYKAALRSMQDSYWEAVGLPSGMARLGPGRRRLDRGAWRAEQDAVTSTARALEVATAARVEAEAATSMRVQAEARAADLAARGREFVARARAAAAAAKVQADDARVEAAAIVAKAERQADRMRRVGRFLGTGWIGLTGVRKRMEVMADRRVAEVQARAKRQVADALETARGEVGGELVRLRRDADRSRREAAEAAASLVQERTRREVAEREREDFRGRWAEADNRLQGQRRAPRR